MRMRILVTTSYVRQEHRSSRTNPHVDCLTAGKPTVLGGCSPHFEPDHILRPGPPAYQPERREDFAAPPLLDTHWAGVTWA